MNKPTLWDGHWYFSSGNPIYELHITYQLPPWLFEQSNPAQCYTANQIQQELARDPSATSLTYDITTTNEVDLEPLTVRKGMWLSNRYASLLIEENLTPFNVWTRLNGVMRAEGLLLFFTPLIYYLCFQLLGKMPLNTALADGNELAQPQIDARLLHNSLSVLQHLAPSSTTAPPPDSSVTTQGMSAVELTALIEALCAGHTAPALFHHPQWSPPSIFSGVLIGTHSLSVPTHHPSTTSHPSGRLYTRGQKRKRELSYRYLLMTMPEPQVHLRLHLS